MDLPGINYHGLPEKDRKLFLGMISLKQMAWGIGGGIALIAFGFALPTMHGLMEIYAGNSAFEQIKRLAIITGGVISPLTAFFLYMYGIGFRGTGRILNIKEARSAGLAFLGGAFGYIIFSIATIYFGIVAGRINPVTLSLITNVFKTAETIKGFSSIIPEVFTATGCIFLIGYYLKVKSPAGLTGTVLILAGIIAATFAKTYIFYKTSANWFFIWEIGNAVKSTGIAVTTFVQFQVLSRILNSIGNA